MALPRYIETNEDVLEWETFLKRVSVDDLVGFMLDRMLIDNKFFELVKGRFEEADPSKTLRDVLEAFDNEVYREFQSKNTDTEYVIAISRNIIRAIDELGEETQAEGYEHIASVIADGYMNFGLAFDDEVSLDIFFEDIGYSLEKAVSLVAEADKY